MTDGEKLVAEVSGKHQDAGSMQLKPGKQLKAGKSGWSQELKEGKWSEHNTVNWKNKRVLPSAVDLSFGNAMMSACIPLIITVA